MSAGACFRFRAAERTDTAGIPPRPISRVRLIRVAFSIGFSVSELASILRVRDSGGAPCRDVRRLAGEKLECLRGEIRALSSLRSDLESVIADWDRRLAKAGEGKRAGLLEALVARRLPGPEAAPGRATARSRWPRRDLGRAGVVKMPAE